jgi:phosphoribosyl 1,2-cyclic phosphodiesterase
LRFSVLSSGSSGNATYIEPESGGRGLLIDAGLSCRKIKAHLDHIGRSLADVEAVLLTHGHGDHTTGLRSLLRERNLPIYAAPGVWKKAGCMVCEPGESFPVGHMDVTFFNVPHDAPTYGVRLTTVDDSVSFATDLGEVTTETLRWMRGSSAVVLEANHDLEWLRRGPYSWDLKRRIASASGHLSNDQAAQAAVELAAYGLNELVLSHLSEKNNSAARATGAVVRSLRAAGHESVRVRVAPAKRPTPWIVAGERIEEPGSIYRNEAEVVAQRLFEVD